MEIINIYDKSDKLFYVGGVVRDELLGIQSLDVDLVYEGDAMEFAQNSGLKLLQVNEPFGTVRVISGDKEIDIASTRCEIYPRKGHLPHVEKLAVSLKSDVQRRDFTINSLYKSVSSGEIVDYTGGINDLKNKKLRVLHNQSFIDDPTRIIRALKFRMRFGFELEENTLKYQKEYLSNINYDMCYKRIKKELIETFGYLGNTELSTEDTFKIFDDEKIYKLLGENVSILPYKKIIAPMDLKNRWIVFAARISDLSKLPLTREEQKILDDFELLKQLNLVTDFEIYKAFEKLAPETILLYKSLVNFEIAEHYETKLKNIKIKITGQDLINLGLKPSKKFAEIMDSVLAEKLKNPHMTDVDELEFVKNIQKMRF